MKPSRTKKEFEEFTHVNDAKLMILHFTEAGLQSEWQHVEAD
jgi:hypothetical protein